MTKNDLLFVILHCFNFKPLKNYIKSEFDPTFKGRSEKDNFTYLNTKLNSSQLKKIIFGNIQHFALEVFVKHVDQPSKEFTETIMKDTFEQYDIDELLTGCTLVSEGEVWPDSKKIFFFIKAEVLYYDVNAAGKPTSIVQPMTFPVPVFIEFRAPKYTKIHFGKFKLRAGIHTLLNGTSIYITKINFSAERFIPSIMIDVVDPILECTSSSTNFNHSIKKFVEDKKMSATHFGWTEPNGKDNKANWASDSSLYSFTYIKNRIENAAEILPSKWYLTNPSKGATGQDINNLDSLKIDPSKGKIITSKFVESDVLVNSINEVIDESN